MGATETTVDPVAALIAQVNRFGPGAPAPYRYVTKPYAFATGKVPQAVAISAAFILQRRAQDGVIKFADSGSIALLNAATAAQKNPVGYVTANIRTVTAEIKAFGDSVGAPAAEGFSKNKIWGIPVTTVGIAAGGVLALGYVLLTSRRKR